MLQTLIIQVDTTVDDPAKSACTSSENDCSLRGAISKANADPSNTYTIQVPVGVYELTIDGMDEDENATGDLDILVSLNLAGEGIDQTIIQAGASTEEGIDRVLDLLNDAEYKVTVSDLTIRHGKLPENNLGAGIQVLGEQISLDLDHVAVRDNLGDGFVLGGGIFTIGNLTAADSQFTGNQTGGDGGGIYQSQFGSVHLERVLISGNTAEFGGGFTNGNTATLVNVTVSGNTALYNGGGISQWNNGDLKIHYSTITNNNIIESTSGWAVYTSVNWNLEIYNSILTAGAGNTACNVALATGHHSISSDSSCGAGLQVADPKLGPLADNGGDTLTHALMAGSPAFNAAGVGGNAISCPNVDQRGFPRPSFNSSACDIGAFEAAWEPVYLPLLTRP